MAISDAIPGAPYAGVPDGIPGTGRLPVFGNTIEFVGDPFAFHRRRITAFGEVYKFHAFGHWTVALHGADALEMVLMDREKNFSSFMGWGVLHLLFPNGLMLRDFDDHRAHRKIMQTAFKPQAMADYVARMNAGISHSIGRWGDARELRFYDAIKDLTLELGASVFLGLDIGAEARKVNKAFVDEVAASIAVIRTPLPGNLMWRGVRARRFLLDFFRELIPARRDGDGVDMFSQLCRAQSEDGQFFTDQEIVDHMNFLLMAAHDTTTSALTTMIWALAQYPEWQESLRAEVADVGGRELAYEDMGRLERAERVFKEALRFRPPVPFIPRYALRPFSYGGYEIPADVAISVSPGLVARDPRLWTDPESFDPDRFSANRAEDQRHRFAWSPFGGGAHKCIGLHFAIMQVKAFTFQFLRHYRVSLPAGHVPRWQALPIPKPKDGLPVRLARLS